MLFKTRSVPHSEVILSIQRMFAHLYVNEARRWGLGSPNAGSGDASGIQWAGARDDDFTAL